MELKDILYYGLDAQSKLRKGINKLADAVKITMGPAGKYVFLGTKDGVPIITKDGSSIAKYIILVDPVENLGAEAIKQAAQKTVEDAADGTTTSIVLTQSILNESDLHAITNISHFRNGLNQCLEDINNNLKNYIYRELDHNILYSIALTSLNQDKKSAKKISELVYKVGIHGNIELKERKHTEDLIKIDSGYKWDRGYLHSHYINNTKDALFERSNNIKVLLIDDKLNDFNLLVPILKETNKNGDLLVVIAEDFDEHTLYNCKQNFTLHQSIIPIKCEDFGERKTALMKDLSIYLDNAEIYEIKDFYKDDLKIILGNADYIKISSDYTIFGFTDENEKLNKRIEELEGLEKVANNEFDKNKIKSRISKLRGSYATVYVGGTTDIERKEKFDRFEDAIGATQYALKEGILPGGGSTLFHISNILVVPENETVDFIHGYKTLKEAIKKPLYQILENADIKLKIKLKDKYSGINANNGEYCKNMIESGIIDPYKVTYSALQNSVSIASIILSTGAVVQTNFLMINE